MVSKNRILAHDFNIFVMLAIIKFSPRHNKNLNRRLLLLASICGKRIEIPFSDFWSIKKCREMNTTFTSLGNTCQMILIREPSR